MDEIDEEGVNLWRNGKHRKIKNGERCNCGYPQTMELICRHEVAARLYLGQNPFRPDWIHPRWFKNMSNLVIKNGCYNFCFYYQNK